MKLLLIDGHNLLFQMFYGMPSRIVNAEGKAIHGVIGFIGALRKIIDTIKPDFCFALFDSENCGSRREVDTDYKANRIDYSAVPEEKNPFSQLEYVYRALEYCNIPYAEAQGCETDDLIASYANNFDGEIVISSFDSDYFQLINDRVKVLRYRGKNSVLYDTDKIIERYGVSPAAFADFKALAGDPSDNIKGTAGIWKVTAAKLINKFGSVPNILHILKEKDSCLTETETQSDKIYFKLLSKIDANLLEHNYNLIKLNGDFPLPIPFKRKVTSLIKTNDILRGIGLLP